jgi:predicted dehydrogenase
VSLNVLVVGGGSIGERHLRCFQQTEPCEVSICETMEERRLKLIETYGVVGFESIEAACDLDWDLVVIATPAHFHIDHALAFKNTKALLIEKPLSTSMDRVSDLVAGTQDKLVGAAYVYRAHPALQAIRGIIQTGTYGDVREVTIVSGQHFPTFRPAYREIYYTDRKTGGGAIQDSATHMFNLIQYLVGSFEWIFCDYAHQVLPGVDVEDTVHLTGRAGGGEVMVNLSLNQFMTPNETAVQVNATDGSMRMNVHEQRYGVMGSGETEWDWSDVLVHERDELFRLQARHMVDACLGKASVLCSLEEAIHTLRINLAALESNGERKIRIEGM